MSHPPTPRLIEIKVDAVTQLFNSMDPSPFHERDLDPKAEEFIVSWTREHHLRTPLRLVIHLGRDLVDGELEKKLGESIHHYFLYRAELTTREFRHLMREFWLSLLIGLGFLGACTFAVQAAGGSEDRWQRIFLDGLTILGWVAMWRPLDIGLYRWWPLWNLSRVYRKLAMIPVEVRGA